MIVWGGGSIIRRGFRWHQWVSLASVGCAGISGFHWHQWVSLASAGHAGNGVCEVSWGIGLTVKTLNCKLASAGLTGISGYYWHQWVHWHQWVSLASAGHAGREVRVGSRPETSMKF